MSVITTIFTNIKDNMTFVATYTDDDYIHLSEAFIRYLKKRGLTADDIHYSMEHITCGCVELVEGQTFSACKYDGDDIVDEVEFLIVSQDELFTEQELEIK